MTTLSTVYASDEQIAVRAGGDFALLCPKWQKIAYGTDGAIVANSWTMTSASAVLAGLVPGHVVWLTKSGTTYSELFGVDSSATGSVTLHRIGMAAGIGVPPAVAGQTGLTFTALTFAPQIEEASFELNRRFGIDAAANGRTAADLSDLRDLRQACVLVVLIERLVAEAQGKEGPAWTMKLSGYQHELDELYTRLNVRWGPTATVAPPLSRYIMRMERG